MKYIISLTSIFIFSIMTVSAQDAVDNIAIKTCSCLKQLDTTATLEEIEAKMGLCMFTEATPYEKELKKKNNIDISALNATTGEAFGKLIGTRMLIKCPDQMLRLGNVAVEKKAAPRDEIIHADPSDIVRFQSIKGIFVDIVPDQFVTVIVKSSDGQEQKFLWLRHFEGADLLSNPSALRGKTVQIDYWEEKYYNPKVKDYIAYKVITDFKVK